MAWLDKAIEYLTAQPVCGYRSDAAPSVEPTALAALALLTAGHGRWAMPAWIGSSACSPPTAAWELTPTGVNRAGRRVGRSWPGTRPQ